MLHAAHLHKLHKEVPRVADDLSRRLLLALGVVCRGRGHGLQAARSSAALNRLSGSRGALLLGCCTQVMHTLINRHALSMRHRILLMHSALNRCRQ